VQLKNYVEFNADRKESMTEIIHAGLEKELKEDMPGKFFLKGDKLILEVEIIRELHSIKRSVLFLLFHH